MEDIKVTEGTILESLNNKADIDGGNYKGSGLQAVLEETTLGTAGGTMDEGAQINFQNKDANSYIGITTRNNYADVTQSTPAVQEDYMYINCFDKNKKITGEILTKHMTSGAVGTCVRAYGHSTGTQVMSELQIGVDKNGITYCSFPKCTVKATTTSSANTSKVAVIVQNYVSGTSWYRVWSDGWIEQGGVVESGSNSNAVTLLKSYSNTNYQVLVTWKKTATISNYGPVFNITSTSSFTIFSNGDGAKGCGKQWYACGY